MKPIFLLLLSSCFVLFEASAQTDWGRVLSGTVKAGQALTITDEDLAKVVRQQVIGNGEQPGAHVFSLAIPLARGIEPQESVVCEVDPFQ